jgi:hypothetical protein
MSARNHHHLLPLPPLEVPLQDRNRTRSQRYLDRWRLLGVYRVLELGLMQELERVGMGHRILMN